MIVCRWSDTFSTHSLPLLIVLLHWFCVYVNPTQIVLLLWLFNIIKHTSWSEYCFMFVQCSSANIIHLSLSTQSSGWFSTWAKHRSYIPLSSSANEKNQASDCRERCGPISVYMFLWKLFSRLQHTQFKITFTVCSEGMMTNSSGYQCQRAASEVSAL